MQQLCCASKYPCSPECKIVGQILHDHPLSYALTATADVLVVYLQQFWKTVSKVLDIKDTIKFKLDTQDITYTIDMFCDTLHLPMETLNKPFIAPVNIKVIESFMQTVGYQGVVNKVSALYTKFLAQPWQTMFKKKDVIQYPRFTKLIIANLIKKFPSIPQRLDEDYHSIKDDILLVSVYSTGNVLFRGMLIPDAFLTNEICATDDYKETTPRAYKTPTLTATSPQGKKRKQSAEETSSPIKSLKITIKQKQVVEEPGSHKEHLEVIHDDDVNDDEKKDEKNDDVGTHDMGSLENRTEKMQITIPTTPRSPMINLSSDKNVDQELTDNVSPSTTTTTKDPHKKRRISSKYTHLLVALRRMCSRQGYMIKDMERKRVTTSEF
ncbi:hypothetical protein Tco_0519716 [Tanacetum coccineum]